MKSEFAACFFAICAVASFCRAQQASGTATPEFEVASVKPATSRELNGLLKYHQAIKEGPVYLLVRGTRQLKLENSKDKGAYPWSGGLHGGMIMGDGLSGINESMADLAWRLSRYLERPVLDRTGLSGSYDFRVEYPSDDPRPDVISMILATVQDLGLKLEASKGPFDSIVIEHAEKPSAN